MSECGSGTKNRGSGTAAPIDAGEQAFPQCAANTFGCRLRSHSVAAIRPQTVNTRSGYLGWRYEFLYRCEEPSPGARPAGGAGRRPDARPEGRPDPRVARRAGSERGWGDVGRVARVGAVGWRRTRGRTPLGAVLRVPAAPFPRTGRRRAGRGNAPGRLRAAAPAPAGPTPPG